MGIPLNDNVTYNAPKPADDRYGPWANVAAALAGISMARRYEGLPVGIGSPVVDYVFIGGTADVNLVEKTGKQRNPFISAFAGM